MQTPRVRNAERPVAWLAAGCWAAAAIEQIDLGGAFAPSPAVAVLVEERWRAATAAHPRMFDGPLVRLDALAAGERLRLALRPSSYRFFWGTNVSDPGLPRADRADPLGCSAAVVSADGHLILGRRAQRLALYPGRVHPFGGCIEPGRGVLDETARELAEEVGIAPADIRRLVAVGVVRDELLMQPELLTVAEVRLDRRAVLARIDADEHHGAWSAPLADADAAAAADPDLTPVARAQVAAVRVLADPGWRPELLANDFH